MQNSLTGFLREHLTGDPNYQGPVRDVIIIPVGTHSALAATLSGINKQFDHLTALLTAPPTRAERISPASRPGAPAKEKATKAASHGARGGSGDILSTIVDDLVGVAIASFRPILEGAEKVIQMAWQGIRSAGNALRTELGADWAWLKSEGSSALSGAKSEASALLSSISSEGARVWSGLRDGISGSWREFEEVTEGLAHEVVEDSKLLWKDMTGWIHSMTDAATPDAGSIQMPDSLTKPRALPEEGPVEPSVSARDQIRGGVATFWEHAKDAVKEWLDTLFGAKTDDGAGASYGDGQGGASGAGRGPGGPGGGLGGRRGGLGGGEDSIPIDRTSAEDLIPGTNEATSGYRSIDERMGKMGADERRAYRASGQYQNDLIDAARSQSGAPLGMGKFDAQAPVKQKYGDLFYDSVMKAEGTLRPGSGVSPYDVVFGDHVNKDGSVSHRFPQPPKPLSQMTVREVYEYQRNVLLPATRAAGLNTSAVGAVQLVSQSLKDDLASMKGGVHWSDRFNETTQKKFMDYEVEHKGLDAWESMHAGFGHQDLRLQAERGLRQSGPAGVTSRLNDGGVLPEMMRPQSDYSGSMSLGPGLNHDQFMRGIKPSEDDHPLAVSSDHFDAPGNMDDSFTRVGQEVPASMSTVEPASISSKRSAKQDDAVATGSDDDPPPRAPGDDPSRKKDEHHLKPAHIQSDLGLLVIGHDAYA